MVSVLQTRTGQSEDIDLRVRALVSATYFVRSPCLASPGRTFETRNNDGDVDLALS